MKKLIVLLLALAMILGLVACGAKEEAAAPAATEAAPAATEAAPAATEAAGLPYEGVQLTFGWAPLVSADVDKAFWDEAMKGFTEQTGATVEVTVNDWSELKTKYLTGFMSESNYDVFYGWPSMLPNFIDAGYLADFADYYTEEEIANEYFWNECVYTDGGHYGIATVGGAAYRCYVYNMDILAECGVTELPTTWTELEAVCAKIQAARPDLYTILLPLAGNTNAIDSVIYQFLTQAGGSIFNEDYSAMTLNTPEMKKAFEFEKRLMDNGYLHSDCLGLSSENTNALFAEGKAAITCMYSPDVYLKDATFEWAATTELADVRSASYNSLGYVHMSAASKNKDAAAALVKYINSPEVKKAYSEQVYFSTPLRATDLPVESDPRMADVYNHPERAYDMPMANKPGDFLDVWMNVQQQILSGQLGIDEALAQFQAQMDAAMEE